MSLVLLNAQKPSAAMNAAITSSDEQPNLKHFSPKHKAQLEQLIADAHQAVPDSEACYTLANWYEIGAAGEVSSAKSMEYLRKAASLGHVAAINKLGINAQSKPLLGAQKV